jgi:hypothetical protein
MSLARYISASVDRAFAREQEIELARIEQTQNIAAMSDPATIAAAITDAPAWAIISLSMPDEQLRYDGAAELARWIAQRIDPPAPCDNRQLGLPL